MSKALSEHIPELGINKKLGTGTGIATKIVKIDTPDEWGVIHLIITEFEKYYRDRMKRVWMPYIMSRRERSDAHALALEGDLREAGFRQSLTFPIFHDDVYDRDDSLQQKLEPYTANIFNNPRDLLKFQRLYPEFVVASKI